MSPPLTLAPITIREARRFIAKHHSHHDAPRGGIVAVSVTAGDRLVCVAILGRPTAMRLGTLRTVAEVTRVASDGSTHGAAGLCLDALASVAGALGYRRVVSYTLLGERGVAYRKQGWRVTGLSDGGEWSRRGRARKAAAQPCRKIRWEIGPEALPKDRAAWAELWRHAGQLDANPRRETLPLLARITA